MPNPERELAAVRILVVEDEPITRLAVVDALRRAGFAVLEASTTEEALALIDAGAPVDLIFSDIHMPGAKTGLDLARTLRLRRPEIPVVLTSGTQQSAANMALGAAFIHKPYSFAEVVAVLTTLVQGQAER